MDGRLVITQRKNHARGSVYVPLLGVAMLVTIIGLSALLAGRLRHRQTRDSSDLAEARFYAQSGIDWGLLVIKQNPGSWRNMFDAWAEGPLMANALGAGSFALEATDPVDGDLTNNTTDPVVLTAIGLKGRARYKLRLQLRPNGSPRTGTFRQVVD
ncbi:MAG TPA: hypothetical protein VM243_13805 [Phycisphaerae bacterium]|nr:hypothetical protein [Phycisphaerae bacterium]